MEHDQVGFIPDKQGWLNILKLVNLFYHIYDINELKEKYDLIFGCLKSF